MANRADHRRVVITGLGVVTPLGNSTSQMWQRLTAGQSGVRALETFPPITGHVVYGGEAGDFTGHIDDFGNLPKDRKKAIRKALKMMCRETMMAVAAAQQAIGDAGLADADPERTGVVYGSDYMLSPPEDFLAGMKACGVESDEFRFDHWGSAGLGEMNPLWMLKYLPNMPASHIGIFNDFRGPNNSLTLREISGTMAIREATQTIVRGHADRMLAGATGTRIHPFKTIHAIQTEQLADIHRAPEEASRPFDRDRSGMVVGEGAAALLLEEADAAAARGAKIYGEIWGVASASSADADLLPRPQEALTLVMQRVLAEAGVGPEQVGHIAAHGLSTEASDRAEAAALAEVFGRGDAAPTVAAAKSYFGNLGAGSGLVELIASLLAIDAGELYKTLNYATADPDCPVRMAEAGSPPGDSCLQLGITPQGQAAAVLAGRYNC